MRDRLAAAAPADAIGGGLTERSLAVVGLLAAAMLLGMAVTRMAAGPVLYVQGLRQEWGETAYLVTQFVGVHLTSQAGTLLLTLWIAGVAWLGARRRILPRLVALLAIVPAFRLLVVLGPFVDDLLPGQLWILLIASIPTMFVWLIVLGATVGGSRGRSEADARSSAARSGRPPA